VFAGQFGARQTLASLPHRVSWGEKKRVMPRGPRHSHPSLPGRAPRAGGATLHHKTSLFGKAGKLWATRPSGETFSRPYGRDSQAPVKTVASTLDQADAGRDGDVNTRCEVSTGGTVDTEY